MPIQSHLDDRHYREGITGSYCPLHVQENSVKGNTKYMIKLINGYSVAKLVVRRLPY